MLILDLQMTDFPLNPLQDNLLQSSDSEQTNMLVKDASYTLATHSVKVRRTGATVEAKSLWELGQDEPVTCRFYFVDLNECF